MAREAWPKEEVIEASGEVVCLAVHRYEQEGAPKLGELWPKSFSASEWAVRLNVLGYPQLRLLDGWGRPLEGLDRFVYARTAAQVRDAMRGTAQRAPSKLTPPKRKLPAGLAKLVPEKLREGAVNPDPDLRTAAWAEVLVKKQPKPDQLMLLFEWETDPVIRLGVLRSMLSVKAPGESRDAMEILRLAVGGPNDYVRSEAIAQLAAIGGEEPAKILSEVILAVLDKRGGYANPNNVLCAATKAAIEVADSSMLEVLERVLAETTENNTAHRYALDGLKAIGKQRGMAKKVKEILSRHGYED